MSGSWNPLPDKTPTLPCPQCGCTAWYDLESTSGTDRIDIETGPDRGGGEDNLGTDIMDSEGWKCRDNDHPATEEIAEQLDTIREDVW